MEEFLKKVETDYQAEIEDILPHLLNKIDNLRAEAVKIHPGIRIANDGKAAGTINREDCRILYLLVRYYKPTIIFEIGTWIGTSAMVMAEAMRKNNNGGKIYTCDANNYYSLPGDYSDIISPITAYSDKALKQLPKDTTIDFLFADGELTFATISQLKAKLNEKSIITTHDYILPDDKGVLNAVRMQLKMFFQYTLITPTYNNNVPDKLNESLIAILVPKTQIIGKANYDSFFFSFYSTVRIALIALFSKISKKFTG